MKKKLDRRVSKISPKHLEKLKEYLSPRDKELQERYDKLKAKSGKM